MSASLPLGTSSESLALLQEIALDDRIYYWWRGCLRKKGHKTADGAKEQIWREEQKGKYKKGTKIVYLCPYGCERYHAGRNPNVRDRD